MSMFRLEICVKVIAIFIFGCAVIMPMRPLKRVNADHFARIANALEAYAVDNGGNFPPDMTAGDMATNLRLPNRLTTPVAYLNPEELNDPLSQSAVPQNRFLYRNVLAAYQANPAYQGLNNFTGGWIVASVGYDRSASVDTVAGRFTYYDPTNGTISGGDMIRTRRVSTEIGNVPNP